MVYIGYTMGMHAWINSHACAQLCIKAGLVRPKIFSKTKFVQTIFSPPALPESHQIWIFDSKIYS